MKWKPIETAPKNTNGVLVWAKKHGIEVGRWSEGFKSWVGDDNFVIKPTHWMPLPDTPTEP